MPNLFNYMGYKIFFWSNENFEPVHVHISKGNPTENSTKIWLTKSGGCVVANNSSRIPTPELKKLMKVIQSNYFYIISEWKLYYDIDEIKFYC